MATPKTKPVIRLLTCGSVDDGKSTLIGRLLVETNSIPQDTLATAKTVRRGGSTIPVGEIDYSLLTDGLEAEREQGITIDVAYRSMSLLNGSRLIIADAPGHEQYTRNMAVAASRADVALVLVDAARGVRSQTLRHLTICALMGVSRVAIVINKLDMFDYSKAKFDEISAQIAPAVDRLKIVEPPRRTVFAVANVSCGMLFVSTSRRPIKVDFPSSTLPQVSNRITGLVFGVAIRNSPPSFSSPLNLHCRHQSALWHVR